jgi:hypothetical protein
VFAESWRRESHPFGHATLQFEIDTDQDDALGRKLSRPALRLVRR